jgi:hypothetical protein
MMAESWNSVTRRDDLARHRCGKHVLEAANQHAKIEELLEAEFHMLFMLMLYSEDQWEV